MNQLEDSASSGAFGLLARKTKQNYPAMEGSILEKPTIREVKIKKIGERSISQFFFSGLFVSLSHLHKILSEMSLFGLIQNKTQTCRRSVPYLLVFKILKKKMKLKHVYSHAELQDVIFGISCFRLCNSQECFKSSKKGIRLQGPEALELYFL